MSDLKKIGPIELNNKIYIMFRNSQGFIELYHSKGVLWESMGGHKVAKGIERHVTNVKDPRDLVGWFRKKRRPKKYDPYKDENQLKIE